jgi:hypothetical protein
MPIGKPKLPFDIFDFIATTRNDHRGLKTYWQLLALPRFGRLTLQPRSQERYQNHFTHEYKLLSGGGYDSETGCRRTIKTSYIKYLPHLSLYHKLEADRDNIYDVLRSYAHSPPQHNTVLPGEIYLDEDERMLYEKRYYNGVLHCTTEPAVKYYRRNGKLDNITWYLRGSIHRDSAPAFIEYNERGSVYNEVWYLHNKRHRADGPAVTGSREIFYYEGKEYTRDRYKNKLKKVALHEQEVATIKLLTQRLDDMNDALHAIKRQMLQHDKFD